MALPTNYKDDVLGDSMDGKRRYRVIENSDGTISLEDVTEYSQTGSDFGAFDINQINEEINKMLPKTGEASNTTAVFQDASSRANLESGEKLSVLFGKISKWLTDLKTVCFTGSYNDLSNRPSLHAVATSGNYNQLNNRPTIGAAASRSVVNNATTTSDGTVLDGRMGKTLNDKAIAAQNTANTANSLANALRDNLIIRSAAVGSAYGVGCSYQANAYFTTVVFNGTNVGDRLAPYTQRNFGTLPAGYRPAVKCQHPVSAIDGLYFTIDTNGVCSMRNEKSTEISFGKAAMHGAITFAH